jgi:predicted protein tyrosine phosphatase
MKRRCGWRNSEVSLKNVLFVCSQNRLRSPTAEQIFSYRRDIEVSSAGTNNDAINPLTTELVEWADIIFVMERLHRNKLLKRFRHALKNAKVICLGIPDEFEFMDPALIRLLETKVSRYLPVSLPPNRLHLSTDETR